VAPVDGLGLTFERGYVNFQHSSYKSVKGGLDPKHAPPAMLGTPLPSGRSSSASMKASGGPSSIRTPRPWNRRAQ
jgi:hypothetical protein